MLGTDVLCELARAVRSEVASAVARSAQTRQRAGELRRRVERNRAEVTARGLSCRAALAESGRLLRGAEPSDVPGS